MASSDSGEPPQAAVNRQQQALKFLVGQSSAPRNVSAVDQDIAAWLLMNSDLFPNQARSGLQADTTMTSAAAASGAPVAAAPGAFLGQSTAAGAGAGAAHMAAAPATAAAALAARTPPMVNVVGVDGKQTPVAITSSPVPPGFGVPLPVAAGAPGGPLAAGTSAVGVSSATTPPLSAALGTGLPASSDAAAASNAAAGAAAATASSAAAEPKVLSASEKRKRRLEKNRVIARNCRKRKRARMLHLEEQVKTLSEANQRLQLRLKQGNDVKRKEDKRVQMLRRIQEMTNKGEDEHKIAEAIIAYKDLFADYGKDRQAAVMYHLEQLRMLLLPTQVTKMCMWSLHQPDEFYDEERNQQSWGGGIWNILCRELHITRPQKRALMGLRQGIKEQRTRLRKSLRMLNDLETHVKEGVDSLESEMLQLMKCVTPLQQARFLLWIENNQACMHMLNNLWKTEPSPPTQAASRPSPPAAGYPTTMPTGAGAGVAPPPTAATAAAAAASTPGLSPAAFPAAPAAGAASGAAAAAGQATWMYGARPVPPSWPAQAAPAAPAQAGYTAGAGAAGVGTAAAPQPPIAAAAPAAVTGAAPASAVTQ